MAKKREKKSPLTGCEVCPLKGHTLALGEGPDNADIVIIGESPSYSDIQQKHALTGGVGNVLDDALRHVGLSRKDCYIDYAVKCAKIPVQAPKAKEINCCRPKLYATIKAHNPKVVVALGKTAMKALLQVNKSITEENGVVVYSTDIEAPVVVTYHPAAILRTPRLMTELIIGLTKAKEFTHGTRNIIVKTPQVTFDVIEEPDDLKAFLSATQRYRDVAMDVENASNGRLLCMGVSLEPYTATVFGEHATHACSDAIAEWFQSKRAIGHGFKHDIRICTDAGIPGITTGGDPLLMDYVLNMVSKGGRTLKNLVRKYLDFYYDYSAEAKPYLSHMEDCPKEILYPYNAHDAALTLPLEQYQDARLDANDRRVLNELLYPASDTFAEMERIGAMVDMDYLAELEDIVQEQVDDITWQLHEIAGREFNPNSNAEVPRIAYKVLGLPQPPTGKADKPSLQLVNNVINTGRALRQPCPGRGFPSTMLWYRNRYKFLSTYIRGLRNAADSLHRVHTNFNLHVTATGRLSSSRPINLQNIKRGKEARDIFMATPGWTMFEVDYTGSLKTSLIAGTPLELHC